MKLATFLIALLFTLGAYPISKAQVIAIDAIEIGSASQSGSSGNLPSVSSFISNTRNPALFRTSIASEIDHPNVFRKEGFQIDFIFSLNDDKRHQFIAGIERNSIESDLFLVNGSIQDTLSVSANYSVRNEYFFLKSGYQFTLRPDKKLSLIAGGQINFGIPVSSRTEEVIFYRELENEEFSFFGKQSATAGLSIPIGIRLKLFRNVSMSLLVKQTFQYYRIDGSPVIASLIGTNLGFYFKLRD